MENKNISINQLWKGIWQTTFYADSMVYGDVFVSLPDILNTEQPYQTNVHIKYNGLYNLGKKIIIPTDVTMIKNPNNSSQGANGSGLIDHFNIKLNSLQQQITFETAHITSDEIKGTYFSLAPYDKGIFTLKKNNINCVSDLSLKKSF
jgi:hypothetical protein